MQCHSFQRKTIYYIGKKSQKKTDLTGLTVSGSGEVVREEKDEKLHIFLEEHPE